MNDDMQEWLSQYDALKSRQADEDAQNNATMLNMLKGLPPSAPLSFTPGPARDPLSEHLNSSGQGTRFDYSGLIPSPDAVAYARLPGGSLEHPYDPGDFSFSRDVLPALSSDLLERASWLAPGSRGVMGALLGSTSEDAQALPRLFPRIMEHGYWPQTRYRTPDLAVHDNATLANAALRSLPATGAAIEPVFVSKLRNAEHPILNYFKAMKMLEDGTLEKPVVQQFATGGAVVGTSGKPTMQVSNSGNAAAGQPQYNPSYFFTMTGKTHDVPQTVVQNNTENGMGANIAKGQADPYKITGKTADGESWVFNAKTNSFDIATTVPSGRMIDDPNWTPGAESAGSPPQVPEMVPSTKSIPATQVLPGMAKLGTNPFALSSSLARYAVANQNAYGNGNLLDYIGGTKSGFGTKNTSMPSMAWLADPSKFNPATDGPATQQWLQQSATGYADGIQNHWQTSQNSTGSFDKFMQQYGVPIAIGLMSGGVGTAAAGAMGLGGSAAGTLAAGTIGGGLNAAFTGQNIGQGMLSGLKGAGINTLTSGIGNAASSGLQSTGLDATTSNALGSAAVGAGKAALTGGDVLASAVGSGLSSELSGLGMNSTLAGLAGKTAAGALTKNPQQTYTNMQAAQPATQATTSGTAQPTQQGPLSQATQGTSTQPTAQTTQATQYSTQQGPLSQVAQAQQYQQPSFLDYQRLGINAVEQPQNPATPQTPQAGTSGNASLQTMMAGLPPSLQQTYGKLFSATPVALKEGGVVPSAAQIAAGNYKKIPRKYQGLDISIENPKGSVRSGTSKDGKAWSTTMQHDYGYIKRTTGADGDQVDVFMGPHEEATYAHVIDQVDPKTGKFDEHKVMLGFKTPAEAVKAYHANYEPGWQGFSAVTNVPMEQFKAEVSKGQYKKPRAAVRRFKDGGAVHMAGGGLLGKAMEMIAPKLSSHVVKPEGGQWLSGSVEDALKPLQTPISPTLHEDMARTGYPVDEQALARVKGLNSWISGPLRKYVLNRMASPSDEIRQLAEQGTLHFEPPGGAPGGAGIQNLRNTLGFPAEGVGESPLARGWELASDRAIMPRKAEDYQNPSQWIGEGLKKDREANPWIAGLPPETLINDPYKNVIGRELGFGHLTDELSNALDPSSGLPPHLQLNPQNLNRLSVKDAVQRVHDINQWRAAQQAEANAQIANNAATQVVREYPHSAETPNPKGLRWVEIRPQEGLDDLFRDQTDKYHAGIQAVKDALKYEGDTMGHCVGGYCDDVFEGRSRIFSLRDAKGEPHVTVEVTPNLDNGGNEVPGHSIVQIKGKQNAAPKPEYLPFVQDFVKNSPLGQPWSDVGDLGNTGLVNMNDVNHVTRSLAGEDIPLQTGYAAARRLMEANPLGQYATPEEAKASLLDIINKGEHEGYAQGGAVEAPKFWYHESQPKQADSSYNRTQYWYEGAN